MRSALFLQRLREFANRGSAHTAVVAMVDPPNLMERGDTPDPRTHGAITF
jgi:hypothetical protein